jgi:hypothetical protein
MGSTLGSSIDNCSCLFVALCMTIGLDLFVDLELLSGVLSVRCTICVGGG